MADVLIAGGGPSGAAAAISGRLEGASVRVVERAKSSRHKVCGEFISPGAQEVLHDLDVWNEFLAMGPFRIWRCALHLGKTTNKWTLPDCGWGLSRLQLDRILLEKAASLGAEVSRGTVFDGRQDSRTRIVLAGGRKPERAVEDRLFGFKAHFDGPLDDAVELFFDECGYVGVSGVENGVTNVCGIAPESSLRKHGFEFDEFVRRSSVLAERLGPLRRRMPWIAVGPLSFSGSRTWTPPNVYMAGDRLGFIDPFTGSGILNALWTGRLAGLAAARGSSPQEYLRRCQSLMSRPFLISSVLRRLAGYSEFHSFARYLPGRLLFRLTRANVAGQSHYY